MFGKKKSGLPAGWVETRIGSLHLACPQAMAPALTEIYRRHDWVYDSLIAQRESHLMRGRRPVVAGTINEHSLVVKRLSHGGMMSPIGKDRFLTPRRLHDHVALAEYLSSHQVPTPQVAFVAWRRVFGLVRCEVGFERIHDAVDADRYFFSSDEAPPDWDERATQIGALVARLHQIGFVHADLNLMNLLFHNGTTYIVDLDKTMLLGRPPSERERERNLARLERSIRKQGRDRSNGLVEKVLSVIRAAYQRALAIGLVAAGLADNPAAVQLRDIL